MRILRLIMWDALFCIVLSVSYTASTLLAGTPTSEYIITLVTCAVCGIFLSQLGSFDTPAIVLIAVPGLYLALAPFLALILNPLAGVLPLSVHITLVPAVLLSARTATLRYAGALAAGYVLFHGKKA